MKPTRRNAPAAAARTGAREGAGPVADALGLAVGAALVLDPELRIEAATAAAVELLGFEPHRGARAPTVLCGTRPHRPVAEALAAGEPIDAIVPSPRAEGTQWIRIRSLPLGPERARTGSLLLLETAGPVDVEGPLDYHGFVTQDAATKQVLRVVERVADSDVTVLVRGETGTGKELIARALHERSHRRSGPFRALNCAALPSTLLESELFGHARGAFTGAIRDVPGHVQLAHGGTLFLDEVAELPLELQAKLLRMLETRTVIPVGAREPIPVDVRIVSATHRSLRAEVLAGRFRSDLMYRLRVVPIRLPSLRERRGDIGLLAQRIVAEINARGRRRVERIAPGAMHALEGYDWPGNVRELRNVLEYAFSVGDGPVLEPSDLPPDVLRGDEEAPIPTIEAPRAAAEDDDEIRRIRAALERAGGRRERAAKILGMSRVTLWRRMRELGLAPRG